jgi:antirestriction protein ArdC
MTNSGARIEHDQFDDAFYNRRSDSIHLPPKEAFKDAPGYYGTALHELTHNAASGIMPRRAERCPKTMGIPTRLLGIIIGLLD